MTAARTIKKLLQSHLAVEKIVVAAV